MTETSETNQLRPIEELLDDLDGWTRRSKLPLLHEAAQRREEIIPLLLTFADRAVADPQGYMKAEHDLLPYALILLAYFREPLSHPLMLSLYRLPVETIDDIIGEELTTTGMPLLLLRTCAGSVDGIKELVQDREAGVYVRFAAMETLALAVATGIADREETLRFLAGLLTGKEAEPGSHFWTGVAHALCDLSPAGYQKQITEAYDRGLVRPGDISIADIEDVIEDGVEHAMEKMHDQCVWRMPEDLDEMLKMVEAGKPPSPAVPPPPLPAVKQKTKNKAKKKMAKASRRKNR